MDYWDYRFQYWFHLFLIRFSYVFYTTKKIIKMENPRLEMESHYYNVDHEKLKELDRWPNFFIVGAPRAGTTTLYEFLRRTPKVFMSSVKEPGYFSVSVNPDLKASKVIRDKNQYLKLFKKVKDEIAIGEATADYLWDPKSAKLIHEVVPKARIIIMLRDPVERAFSHYLLLLSIGSERVSFQAAIKNALEAKPDYSGRIIECGYYYEQVKRYLEIFGVEQVKVVIFEEFIQKVSNNVKGILEFLAVTSEPPKNVEEAQNVFTMPRTNLVNRVVSNSSLNRIRKKIFPRGLNPTLRKVFTKRTTKPQLSLNDKKILEDTYQKDVLKLQRLLGRTLPWSLP